MAETVGQHSVAAFTSPVNGTTPIDANSVRGNDNTVRSAYVDHDADTGIHVQSSTLASRPVAGTAGRKWITVSSGRYQLWYDDGSRWHEVASDAINVDCLADANLAKGDVVKITGFNNGQNLPTVNKVTSSTDVAFGLVENTVTSGNLVQIVNTGLIEDVDTSAFAINDILYPNTSGGLTLTKPTSGNYQPVAYVLRSNANNGVLYVEFSAPRIVERSDNTVSTVVLRDASGNFAAGTITAGALTASGAVSAGSVTSTGLVTFASLKGTGATTVTNILNDGTMATASATTLATSSSIKTYVDSQVATVDTLAEVLANGNTTGATDIIVTASQKITTDTIAETTAAAGVTIDSVLLKDDVVNATDIEVDTISANNGTLAVTLASTGVATIAQQPILSSLTASQAVFTDASKGLVSNAITGTGNVVMSASPTLTGTVTAATLNATTLGGTLSTAAQPNVTSLGTLTGLTVTNPITGSVTGSSGSTTGNAATATALQTARTINGVSFDGTANITVTADAGTLTGATLASNVLASSLTSLGTLSSLTVSGDLTVDTSTLKVDSTNNRVGVGTASPATNLHLLGVASANADFTHETVSAATAARTRYLRGGSVKFLVGLGAYTGGDTYEIAGPSSVLATIDASGNLGLGVTPSAWSSGAGFAVAQYKGGFIGSQSGSYLYIGQNAYFDTTDSRWERVASGLATMYEQTAGIHFWLNAVSSTANTEISFTQAMTLDASGNLLVGATANPGILNRSVVIDSGSSSLAGYILQNDTTGRTSTDGSALYISGSSLNLYNLENSPMVFGTNNTERARITSGGYFKASDAGTYAGSTGNYHELRTSASTRSPTIQNTHASQPFGILIEYTAAAPNGAGNDFVYCSDNAAARAVIRSNGGLANYQANNVDLSDARTKTDITPAASMWDKVAALEIVAYKYIDQTHDDVNLGVIAQQVEAVEPVWVDADGFGETPEGEEPFKTVYNKDIYFAAIKALQEAMARIEALEARLEALEA